ncbi:hypothetical protein RHGRI_005971 [Rhododendron griersonianum]|uniref:Uncharacterized protein n=1 Tax=Rhododendron griersonianum TaxID=479676 RepID=A0AAV6LE62_9ERIC|nr:hypothetical protein RHGRI_005971 [Rhododendron griersonianum]
MENSSMLCPVKYSEQRKQTTIMRPSPPAGAVSGGPRVVRISVTDGDATDSSSDEEVDLMFRRRRVKKFVNEVTIESCYREEHDSVAKGKNRRRKPAGGKLKPTATASRLKLRGPDALINFANPPSAAAAAATPPEVSPRPATTCSGYNSSEESNNNQLLSSPKSVLRFNYSPVDETASSSSQHCQQPKTDAVSAFQKVKEEASVSENFSDFPAMETLFPDVLFDFQDPVPDLSGLFEESGFREDIFVEDCGQLFIGSGDVCGYGQSTWPADDYLQFQDIGDLFGSDSLVAL